MSTKIRGETIIWRFQKLLLQDTKSNYTHSFADYSTSDWTKSFDELLSADIFLYEAWKHHHYTWNLFVSVRYSISNDLIWHGRILELAVTAEYSRDFGLVQARFSSHRSVNNI